ncbi:winged helix-turn-helix transcriptional regulator [Pseudoteredinibacter isoporae]|uniref:DNA-binding HxlR family transcriptional regulator n=1 Tax=Pseudoteredinibacter isoporae TaxID=570281 RepID=A0A7X0JUJ8_9GAMM|nr:helix-turn-helix domain-containing protein [Pseudoteredinibacter isoporae]MBB6522523.1 DNA-binding HxlR family transcriptional regulator [Pseudoteredinibacter isoporae]NHO88052.1 helix-turn-helix transcriptional regulator [Pseudoteredinibacter isoporae]NIB23617.1 helix-turn-helix transcriptional regulator [Pseudoteredinibacter isoporae]
MLELPSDRQLISANVFVENCPARHLLNKISGKWSLLVIDALSRNSMRNGELLRHIEGISQKVLTKTLRDLEDMKLIARHDQQTNPPRVDYELTELGNSLREIVCSLDRWIEENMLDIVTNNPALKVTYT